MHQSSLIHYNYYFCFLIIFAQHINLPIQNSLQVGAIYLDFSKTFDTINYNVLKTNLISLDFPHNLRFLILNYILRIDHTKYLSVNILLILSLRKVAFPRARPLYNPFINYITQDIDYNILLFADHIKLFRIFKSKEDFKILQSDLNKLV